MSEQESKKEPEEKGGWRDLLKRLGREEFQMREMERLGFWPPDQATAERTAAARAAMKEVADQLAPLRERERELTAEIAKAGDVPALLAEIRLKRIERVRNARTERKEHYAREKAERAEKDKAWRASTLPYLGRGVSAGLQFEGGDEAKLQSQSLPVLKAAEELAVAMEITTAELAWLTYHRGAAAIDHYNHFTIPKKSGGSRSISSPKTKLRAAQSWLLQNVLQHVAVHEAAMAFRPGLNIVHNALRHAGAAVIVRLDLKDFFPSITFPRVKRLFQSLGYNEGVATIFALLATEAPRVELTLDGKKHFVAVTDRFLPQGACTSPAITNILCHGLDKRLSGAAQKMGFVYTRYADDLVFSSRADKANAVAMRDFAAKIVADEKLIVNDEKTAILRPRGRQAVTGLVVNALHTPNGNGAPRVSRRDIRKFRAFLHQYELRGREAMTEKMGQDALSYARGYLSFIYMVSPQQEAAIRQRHPWLERRQA